MPQSLLGWGEVWKRHFHIQVQVWDQHVSASNPSIVNGICVSGEHWRWHIAPWISLSILRKYSPPAQKLVASRLDLDHELIHVFSKPYCPAAVHPAMEMPWEHCSTWVLLRAGGKPMSSIGRWGLVRVSRGQWALWAPFTVCRGKQNSAPGGSVGHANQSWVGAICIRTAQGLSSWIRTFKPLFGVLTEQKRCGHLWWLLKKCAWSHSHSLLP